MTCMLPFVSQLFACCICFWLAQGRRSVRITSSHCLQRCCDKCALQRLMVDRDDNEKRCMRKDALLMYDSHTSPNDRCLLAWERIRMPTWQARGTHIQLPQETEVGPACNVRCICRYSELHLRSLSRNLHRWKCAHCASLAQSGDRSASDSLLFGFAPVCDWS